MRDHAESIKSFQYPAEPWENKNPNWEIWAAEVDDVGDEDELPKANPLYMDHHQSDSALGVEREFNPQTAIRMEGRDHEIIRQTYEEGRIAGCTEGLLQGRREGEVSGREAELEKSKAEREREKAERSASAGELINGFYREQERYLHEVEQEVAKLALALAARILRREAQLDPLFLTGSVRVALGQLSESTRVVLQVPKADLGLWTDAMRLVPNLTNRPTVVAGEGMLLGECRIQTEMGSVDLGVKSQLAEIERGFFDRVGQREEVNPSPSQSTLPGMSNRPCSEREVFQNRATRPETVSVKSQNITLQAMHGQYLDEPIPFGEVETQLNDKRDSDSYDAEWTTAASVESETQGEAISQQINSEVLS